MKLIKFHNILKVISKLEHIRRNGRNEREHHNSCSNIVFPFLLHPWQVKHMILVKKMKYDVLCQSLSCAQLSELTIIHVNGD